MSGTLTAKVRLLVVLGLAAALLSTTAMFPPQAAHAGDGRRADVLGELRSYFIHFLGRQPTARDMDHFATELWQARSCAVGVLAAGRDIANSAEAHQFLRTNDRRANSLYAGLLDRAADPSGWRDQKAALDRGMRWSTVVGNVQSSPEFQFRLRAMCAGSTPGQTIECTPTAAMGPPSASIPPDLQQWFRCQPPGVATQIVFDPGKCLDGAIEVAGGQVLQGLAKRDVVKVMSESRRLIVKRISPTVAFFFTGWDLIQLADDCFDRVPR